MPEIAEVRLMKEFINIKMKNNKANNFYINPENVSYFVMPNEQYIPLLDGFNIEAFSRGKELQLVFNDDIKITFTLGMSGNFEFVTSDEIDNAKYVQFTIDTDIGYLCFTDMRKFGKWKLRDWNENRGPDPINDFQKFQDNITANVKIHKDFEKPLYELMLNQKWFNGIGNYLRAEILGRIDFNPYKSLRELYNENIIDYIQLLNLCRDISLKAYKLGGAQFRDWKNPFNTPSEDFDKFIQYYRNTENCNRIKDSNDRTFWIDKKWDK